MSQILQHTTPTENQTPITYPYITAAASYDYLLYF